MTELQRILAALDAPAVLATVVNVEGSAYRRAGARMLVMRDGRSIGTISGGCLESDIIERAWQLTDTGKPALIRYDASGEDDPEWGFGLGCNGAVDVLIERVDPQAPPAYLTFLQTALAHREASVIATVFSHSADASIEIGRRFLGCDVSSPWAEASAEAILAGESRCCSVELGTGTARAFIEFIAPPPHLLVLGAGQDAVPVVRLAKESGWVVSVCDRRSGYATAERFPLADAVHAVDPEQTLAVLDAPPDAAVVMTHRYPEDLRLLQLLFSSEARYIGLLGPIERTNRLLRDLARDGFTVTPEMLRRLHAPIGLDIGAQTPEEIALAIVAEATAALAGHAGGKLRDKGGPIHQRERGEMRDESGASPVRCINEVIPVVSGGAQHHVGFRD